MKKIFEVKENSVSVANIVLAMFSLASIFTSIVLIIVIWGFKVAVSGSTDVVFVVFDIVVTIATPVCIIIRNLKLKNVRKFIGRTFLEYAIAFALMFILLVVYMFGKAILRRL